MKAAGTFEVKLTPQSLSVEEQGLGRMTLEKTFQGDFEGRSGGEMLSAMTAVAGSAGAVAVERLTGTLHGRSGTFMLLHRGIMTRGEQGPWTIAIVPDSGTGELTGITGTFAINLAGGQHAYELEYELA